MPFQSSRLASCCADTTLRPSADDAIDQVEHAFALFGERERHQLRQLVVEPDGVGLAPSTAILMPTLVDLALKVGQLDQLRVLESLAQMTAPCPFSGPAAPGLRESASPRTCRAPR